MIRRLRIVWRNKIIQDLRTAGRLQTFRADVVLDSHRNAGQRSGQLSVIDLLLYGFRLCQRALRIYRYVAVVFLFSRLDLIEGSLYGFFYRNLFLFDFLRQLHGCHAEDTHLSSPILRFWVP